MSKHLSLSDRALIERALVLGSSFSAIGNMLGRSPTTISREVRHHRTFVSRNSSRDNDCLNFAKCLHKNVCPYETKHSCFSRCKFCKTRDCRKYCKDYETVACPDLDKPPYVCNGCSLEKICKKNHAYYTAHKAHAAYQKELSESRRGLRASPEKLERINSIVSPLVFKGQSLNHILATHQKEIGVSEKTLYNYVNANVFKAKDIHLPKKVSYRARKQERPILTKTEYKYRQGRTWEAFENYKALNPDANVVEMDTVKGTRDCKKTLLTFSFSSRSFMINGEKQVLRPHFTFHGFRYICIEGLEEGQTAIFTACHLSSDLQQTGTFTCSDARVNRLQQNILWGQRDNYLDVPTDCPQRSERLGWTGDATAFTPTAAFNQNIMPFMRKWLRDLAADQNTVTGMAQVVPDVLSDGQTGGQNGSAYWGDAATVVPWTLYQVYGDMDVLREQYPSMKIWVEYVRRQCGENGLYEKVLDHSREYDQRDNIGGSMEHQLHMRISTFFDGVLCCWKSFLSPQDPECDTLALSFRSNLPG